MVLLPSIFPSIFPHKRHGCEIRNRNPSKRYDCDIYGARVSESGSSRRFCLLAFVSSTRILYVCLIEPTYCAWPIIRIHRTPGFTCPRGCSYCWLRRDAYPSLCTEVLNAIMQYKDTIGNSMVRVLCSVYTKPAPSNQILR